MSFTGWMILSLVFIISLVIGNHFRLKQRYKKKQKIDEKLFKYVFEELEKEVSQQEVRAIVNHSAPLLSSIKEKTHFPLTNNNQVTVLANGEDKYPALFKAIKEAQHHIHLLYYTIKVDGIGQQLLELLKQKAKEGIEVRLIIDGVGSHEAVGSKGTLEELNQAGVELGIYAPPKLRFLWHLNFRNHRKIVVIDGKVGFTGGLNIGDEYLHKDPQKGYWRDIHVQLEGKAVILLQKIFATDWYYVKNQRLEDHYFNWHPVESTVPPASKEQALVQALPSGPDMHERIIDDVYLDMLSVAKEKIWLTTPYFIPDQKLFRALKKAALQGIDVRLLVPQKTDNPIVQAASYHFFQPLLLAGVKIYQYQKGFYHAKMALIDDEVVKIGSANFDRRSFYYSFEAGVFIYHAETCSTVHSIFEQDFQDSTLLQPSQIRNRTFLQKAATQLSLLLTPWL